MISKDRRLTKAEIVSLKQNPQKLASNNLLTLFKKTPNHKTKIAVVISKKIESKAVNRNRLKREIIDIVADRIKNLNDLSISLIFYPRKPFIGLSHKQKQQTIISVIDKICKKVSQQQ